jgi:hypothetical protein
MKGIQQYFKSPLFCFHGNCSKVCPTDSDLFLAYLVPLDVDVVPIRHGNGQNAKKLKNTKMIIAGYSPNRK